MTSERDDIQRTNMHIKALTQELRTHTQKYTHDEGEAMSGEMLAQVLKALAAREVAKGGPYAVQSGGGIADADIGLNLIVASFLRARDIRLPKLDAYIHRELTKGNCTSSVIAQAELDALAARYRASDADAGAADSAAPAHAHSTPAHTERELRILTRIHEQADARFARTAPALHALARETIEDVTARNADGHMSLMAYFMRDALGTDGSRFDDATIAAHGLANICFWSAFIIYDDFWDEDEDAQPRLLPVANLFARHYIDYFTTLLPKRTGFRAYVHIMMDSLDAANAWELMHCRMRIENDVCVVPDTLPEYGTFDIKFYPAAGHVLGPVAMLVASGHPVDGEEVAAFVEYARHYLIAMQLNDDMHDWKEDLARGHISTAVYTLLTHWRTHHPEHTRINLAADMQHLERLFWFEAVPALCEQILERTHAAREALTAMRSVQNHAPLAQFIDRNERAAREARAEHTQSLAFLSALSDE